MRSVRACPKAQSLIPTYSAEVALRQAKLGGQAASVVGDNVWLATDRLTTLGLRLLRDVDFGYGFWTPGGGSGAGGRILG
jgi:hypothetical protein